MFWELCIKVSKNMITLKQFKNCKLLLLQQMLSGCPRPNDLNVSNEMCITKITNLHIIQRSWFYRYEFLNFLEMFQQTFLEEPFTWTSSMESEFHTVRQISTPNSFEMMNNNCRQFPFCEIKTKEFYHFMTKTYVHAWNAMLCIKHIYWKSCVAYAKNNLLVRFLKMQVLFMK